MSPCVCESFRLMSVSFVSDQIASYREKRPLSASDRRPLDNKAEYVNVHAATTGFGSPNGVSGGASVAGMPGGSLSSGRSSQLQQQQHRSPSFEKVAEVREPLSHMKELASGFLESHDREQERDADVVGIPSPHGCSVSAGYGAEHPTSVSTNKGYVHSSAESVASETRSEILEKDNTISELRETIQVPTSTVSHLHSWWHAEIIVRRYTICT